MIRHSSPYFDFRVVFTRNESDVSHMRSELSAAMMSSNVSLILVFWTACVFYAYRID